MESFLSLARRWGTFGTLIVTALTGVVINLVIYGLGTLAGGTFDFTDNGTSYHVDALTLSGFTAIPIIVGLTVVALLSRWWHWVFPVGIVVALVASIGTIFTMTLPADLDTTSTVTLAIAHVMVGIVTVGGILGIRSRSAN